jgi:hypothetical protein
LILLEIKLIYKGQIILALGFSVCKAATALEILKIYSVEWHTLSPKDSCDGTS